MSITTINAYAVKHRGGRAEPFSYQRTLSDRDVLVRITHASVARGDVPFANVNDVNEAIDKVRNRTTSARVVLQR